MNLLDMLQSQVGSALAKQAAGFLGESENNVSKGLGAAFPAILGSMINKVESPSSAQGIFDLVSKSDPSILGNIGNLFGGGSNNTNSLLDSGGGILKMLLGDKIGGIVDIISKLSGMKSGSSSSLLKMAAPFVIGMIGKQIKGKGLSALTDLLMGQKSYVSKALPSEMGSLLGFANTGGSSNYRSETSRPTSSGNARGGGLMKWLIPLLLIGGLIMAWQKGCFSGAAKTVDKAANTVKDGAKAAGNAVGNAADAVGGAAKDAAGAVADATKAAFAKVDAAAKAALDKIKFEANSAGAQMMDFINGGFKGDGRVRFNNLNFATGSAKLDAHSMKEIDNLAAILKAYPNVKISIDGYTDNTGDAAKNLELSKQRAGAVMGRLIAQGIAANRIKSAGHGSANPVGDNNTAAGRAQNRRIEVTILK